MPAFSGPDAGWQREFKGLARVFRLRNHLLTGEPTGVCQRLSRAWCLLQKDMGLSIVPQQKEGGSACRR